MKVLITSGGCKVPIDDVRHIGNFSSGRYGSELAEAFIDSDVDVIFFSEKGSYQPRNISHNLYGEPIKYKSYTYKDYYEYLTVKDIIKKEQPDIIISAAAISDYVVDKTEGKISSDNDELVIKLKKGEKVIKAFRELAPKAYIVGFKLLVGPDEDQISRALYKVFDSGVDMVIYNDLLELRKGNSTRRLYYTQRGEYLLGGYINTDSTKSVVDEILAEAHFKNNLLK